MNLYNPCQDLHTHSSRSGGKSSVADMADSAVRAGLSALGICIHTPTPDGVHARPQKTLPEFLCEIRAAACENKALRLYAGAEWDVLSTIPWDSREDGTVSLASFDYVIGTVHYITVEEPLHEILPTLFISYPEFFQAFCSSLRCTFSEKEPALTDCAQADQLQSSLALIGALLSSRLPQVCLEQIHAPLSVLLKDSLALIDTLLPGFAQSFTERVLDEDSADNGLAHPRTALRMLVRNHRRRHFPVGETYQDAKYMVNGYFKGDADRAIRLYYAQYKAVAENPYVRIVGHFDLPMKFCAMYGFRHREYHVFDENSAAFREASGEAIRLLTDAGKIFELNTDSIPDACPSGASYRSWEWLSRLHKLGGRVTIASGAHHAADVGRGFRAAAQLLAKNGFEEIWILEETERDGKTFLDFVPRKIADLIE